MVGEEREKMPPPAILKSRLRLIPFPPRIVKPSMRSSFVNPLAKTTVEQTGRSGLGTQKSTPGFGVAPWPRMHVFPVPSIVVTAYPPVEMTETPGRMRIDSL